MPQRFIKKNQHRRLIRPANRTMFFKPESGVVEPDNKDIKEHTEMNTSNIEQLKSILDGDETKLPKRKVKIEKKDKGLIERTENSTILITEDNKMMLND